MNGEQLSKVLGLLYDIEDNYLKHVDPEIGERVIEAQDILISALEECE